MPILKVTVENADELLNASFLGAGALGRVERSATGGGAGYSEISTFALVSGTRLYTVYDLAGADSSWYRVRYSKPDGSSPSSYGDEFQAGGETAGHLCSLYDLKQQLGITDATDDELLLEFIRDTTTDIEGYTGRWFVPRPASGTTTYLFTAPSTSRRLRIPKGIRSVTALGYATTDQPDTGGTYTSITATDAVIRPGTVDRDAGWPGTYIDLLSTSSGMFYGGVINGISITGAFGWSSPPGDIASVARSAIARRFVARRSGVLQTVGPESLGSSRVLRWTSPEERETLDRYRVIPV